MIQETYHWTLESTEEFRRLGKRKTNNPMTQKWGNASLDLETKRRIGKCEKKSGNNNRWVQPMDGSGKSSQELDSHNDLETRQIWKLKRCVWETHDGEIRFQFHLTTTFRRENKNGKCFPTCKQMFAHTCKYFVRFTFEVAVRNEPLEHLLSSNDTFKFSKILEMSYFSNFTKMLALHLSSLEK